MQNPHRGPICHDMTVHTLPVQTFREKNNVRTPLFIMKMLMAAVFFIFAVYFQTEIMRLITANTV